MDTHNGGSVHEKLAQNFVDLERGWLDGDGRVVTNWHY